MGLPKVPGSRRAPDARYGVLFREYNPVMTRLTVAAAVAAALLGGRALLAQQAGPSPDETALLNSWFEKKSEEQLAFSPIQQTFLGRKSAAIDDMSIAAQDRQLAWQRASVAEMKQAFDYAKLTPEAQASSDLWIYQLQQALPAGAPSTGVLLHSPLDLSLDKSPDRSIHGACKVVVKTLTARAPRHPDGRGLGS